MQEHINRLYYKDIAVIYNKQSSLYEGPYKASKSQSNSRRPKAFSTKVLISLYGSKADLILDQLQKSKLKKLLSIRPSSAQVAKRHTKEPITEKPEEPLSATIVVKEQIMPGVIQHKTKAQEIISAQKIMPKDITEKKLLQSKRIVQPANIEK